MRLGGPVGVAMVGRNVRQEENDENYQNLKDEQIIIIKRMTSSICTKFVHFLVVLVRKYMVQKFLISYRFDFLDRFFFATF